MSFQGPLAHIRTLSARHACKTLYVTRAFSTSPAYLAEQPPPESPLSILIPKPALSEHEEKLPPARGHLPVPRHVFHPSEGNRKVTDEYLKQTAPEPTNEASQQPVQPGSAEEWRRVMAVTRRGNLKAGLTGLWERKQIRDDKEEKKRQAKIARDTAAVKKPEPRSEIFTRSTILQATALDTAVLPDPDRMERAEESRKRTAQKLENEKMARRNHLVELYMKATKFIVNESQLQREIDRLFSENYWVTEAGSYADGNAWASWGQPPSVENMLNEYANSSNTRMFNTSRAGSVHNAMRQKQVAQELMGGKIF